MAAETPLCSQMTHTLAGKSQSGVWSAQHRYQELKYPPPAKNKISFHFISLQDVPLPKHDVRTAPRLCLLSHLTYEYFPFCYSVEIRQNFVLKLQVKERKRA